MGLAGVLSANPAEARLFVKVSLVAIILVTIVKIGDDSPVFPDCDVFLFINDEVTKATCYLAFVFVHFLPSLRFPHYIRYKLIWPFR